MISEGREVEEQKGAWVHSCPETFLFPVCYKEANMKLKKGVTKKVVTRS